MGQRFRNATNRPQKKKKWLKFLSPAGLQMSAPQELRSLRHRHFPKLPG